MPECGLKRIDIFEIWKKKPEGWVHPWFKSFVPGYRSFNPKEAAQYGYPDAGICYKTSYLYLILVAINPEVYLPWLLSKFVLKGGKTIRKTVSNLSDTFLPSHNYVVNCAGLGKIVTTHLGARDLDGVNDPNVYPTRGIDSINLGQIMLVDAPHIHHIVCRFGILGNNF